MTARKTTSAVSTIRQFSPVRTLDRPKSRRTSRPSAVERVVEPSIEEKRPLSQHVVWMGEPAVIFENLQTFLTGMESELADLRGAGNVPSLSVVQ